MPAIAVSMVKGDHSRIISGAPQAVAAQEMCIGAHVSSHCIDEC
jgi:hypothetical protein